MDIVNIWNEKSNKCLNLQGCVAAYDLGNGVNFEVLSNRTTQNFVVDTKFQAASLSKLVGVIVCLKFLEMQHEEVDFSLSGKLEIPVIKETTLKHIFSHCGGINVSGFAGYKKGQIPNIKQIIHGMDGANSLPISQSLEFGKYSYSGGGYCLAQEYFERLSQKRINELADKILFTPLNLVNTTFDLIFKDKSCAVGHNIDGKEIENGWNLYPEAIAAGLWTTPCEYLKILKELIKGYYGESQIISAQIAHNILTPFVDCKEDNKNFKYALGVRLSQNIYWHSGSNKGYKCFFAFDLASRKVFVIMSNDDNAENIFAL